MDTFEKYFTIGSKLGYEEELRKKIYERDKIDRDERHAVRQLEARKLDAEQEDPVREKFAVEKTQYKFAHIYF